MSDVIEAIVMDHSQPVAGQVPVLHAEPTPAQPETPEQPKPAQPREQEVQVDVTVKPAEQPKPDQE